ncbi:MAG TPA: ABC transporter permease [Chloroflexota bacterium]|nr:ABC transporter permease [Chloroflexota bacterium]
MAQQTAIAKPLGRPTPAASPELPFARSSKPRSLWTDAWRRLLRNRMAIVGMVIITVFALMAITADVLTPYDMNDQHHESVYRPPAWAPSGDSNYLLGTDGVGRDELSRLIYGARVSLVVGVVPVTLNLLIGTTLGMAAGYLGGRVDNLLMRLVDVFFAFPDLLLIIIMSVAFRETWIGQQLGGLLIMFIAIAVTGWVGTSRIVRGQVLSQKRKEYIEAARAIGAGHFRIMSRHLMPNILAPLIVGVAFAIPGAIFTEAALSFIGLGIRPPTASWGNMIQDGLASIYSNQVLIIAPAICVALVMLSFTFLGDGLRDALDPRMKQ